MADKKITSRQSPAVKRYVQLAGSRRARYEQELFVTEGVKLTGEAFAAGYRPVELFATEEVFESAFDILSPVALAAESFYRITPVVADKLAQSVSPQGVFGVFRMLDNGTQPVKISSNGRFLLLSSLQDPGNLGAILRTAAAFGARVVLSGDCPDLYSPKVLRASMGGVFRAPVAVSDDLGGWIDALREAGVPVWAAALRQDAKQLREVSLGEGGYAVVIGNEGNGLADEIVARCTGSLIIPMEPGSESLNAAMAAGIFLWEMYR